MVAFHFADVVHAADVRVRHLSGVAHFGVEALEQRRVFGEILGQEFQRHGLAEL